MKKALKINLSGQIFHIDEDAYEKLKVYLDTISSHFSNINESKEILSDIESRIAELFHEKMSDENQVISVKEVDEVIDIMGRPEEIVDDDQSTGSQKHREQRANRRLYRDPENAVLGGVSAGLSAYFDLDILLIRILFIVFTVFGAGALVYIILWIAVPRAETAAEKLEMRGEKVTVSNIEKTVKEEYEEVKENFKKARNSQSFRRTEDGLIHLFKVLGTIVIVFFKIILGFFALALVLAGLGLLFGTVSFVFFGSHFLPFGPNGNFHHSLPELIQPFVNPDNASIFIIAVMLLVLIPLLSLVYGLFKVIFRFKAKDRTLGLTAIFLWIMALIATFMLLYYEGRNYKESDTVTETKNLAIFQGDTLYLAVNEAALSKMESENFIDIDHKWFFSEDMDIFYGDIEINVRKSADSDFRVRIEKTSRGRDNSSAKELAQNINYEFQQKESSLTLNPYYMIEKDRPWRAQSVEVTIYVPLGKAVNFDKNTEDFTGWVHNSEDLSDWEIAGKTLIMKKDGLCLP